MKIYKSDLQGLLEEVEGPLYLFAGSTYQNGQLPYVIFAVHVSGFNRENRVCELRIAQPAVITHMETEVQARSKRNGELLKEIKMRLDSLGRTYLDGVLSDTPVAGVLE